MRLHRDIEIAHDLVKYLAARHWTVVQVQGVGAATEREPGIGLGGHRAEQEFERRFHILPIGAVIFLIGHATAIIHHAIGLKPNIDSAGEPLARGGQHDKR
jgi:hypothetical protein